MSIIMMLLLQQLGNKKKKKKEKVPLSGTISEGFWRHLLQ